MKVIRKVVIALALAAPTSLVSANGLVTEDSFREAGFLTGNHAGMQEKVSLQPMTFKDVIVVPPSLNQPETESSLEELIMVEDGTSIDDFRVEETSIRMAGDVALRTVRWAATLVSANNARIINGEITNVMERHADGNWVIHYQSWN